MIKKLIRAAFMGWLAKRVVGRGRPHAGWGRRGKSWKALRHYRYGHPMPYGFGRDDGPRGVAGLLLQALMQRFRR